MASVDVTVRGAGIFGLSIAWAMAQRGARVRVIDTVGIGAGSSGGLVGALSPHVPESWNEKKAFQLDSLLMAGDWWGEVASVSGRDPGYARLGRLQPLEDAAAVEVARRREVSARDLWRGQAEWQVVPVSGDDWEPVSPSGWLVRDTLSARIFPRMGLAALGGSLAERGVEIVVGEGEDAGQVIHATGVAGLAELSGVLGKRIGGGVKGQALSLRFPAVDLPQLFACGLHVVPHGDGTVAIGSTSENQWSHDGVDGAVEGLLARAVAALPVLAGAPVVDRWAGLRPRAISRAPVMGAWPGRAGHWVANGGFKIGFGMAPKVAEVMADLVLDGRDGVPEGFRIEGLL